MNGDPSDGIPLLVRQLENPSSRFALPGKIDLNRHDCLHAPLDPGFSFEDEAFVVGSTMGHDLGTNGLHLAIFKIVSLWFQIRRYRSARSHISGLDAGLALGRRARIRNVNQLDFVALEPQPLSRLREMIGIG
jgi:hypothetical protein